MPRALNKAGLISVLYSNTCRLRKLKCDEATPICQRCEKSGRYCDRSTTSIKIYPYSGQSSPGGVAATTSSNKFPSPVNPRRALSSPHVARYFHHYIIHIAPWYDLSDASMLFGTQLPAMALDSELLFSAMVALSAIHIANTTAPTTRAAAEFYHGCCIRLLIGLEDSDLVNIGGTALATTCLLRSYEILAEEEDPNRHLQGAYSLASQQKLLLNRLHDGLVARGFWNYLREDITFSLYTQSSLKMDLDTVPALTEFTTDQCYLNSISLILGRIVNATFGMTITEQKWIDLFNQVQAWRACLPKRIEPYSRIQDSGPVPMHLPSIWTLQDCHAAALHYHLVSLSVLAVYAAPSQLTELLQMTEGRVTTRADLLEQYALDICGIAFTTNSAPVIVNFFGPIAYCGRFIHGDASRQEVIRRLHSCKSTTGWPVNRLIKKLEEIWQSSAPEAAQETGRSGESG
ncbi:hypothetical protein GQ53DRAFT_790522 [Thozetella sp. PMI_491]|nr:hypothetical protein GQ53DRAFT_790522 [Thozetella sp. PMI_491]